MHRASVACDQRREDEGNVSTALLRALTGPESSGPRLILEACSPFKVVLANPAWCALTGYSADEIVGNTVALLHGPLTCVNTLNALEVAMGGESCANNIGGPKR